MNEKTQRCEWGCDYPCKTYGQHLRNKGLSVMGLESCGVDRTRQKEWDRELQSYRDARSQGIQPSGTKTADIERAVRMSDRAGKAYDATTGTFGEGV